MADFLDQKRQEIANRLRELRPLVEEYRRLEAAEAALAGVGESSGAGRRTTTRTRSANGRSAGRGRPRGTGTRAREALELVRSRPGITIPEIAEAMGIKQNYLYRVLPSLQRDGLVRKEGRGWHAREGAAPAAE
jgi:sugar-specific transcriptional regulator TrmB